jgi:hypothetical protein
MLVEWTPEHWDISIWEATLLICWCISIVLAAVSRYIDMRSDFNDLLIYLCRAHLSIDIYWTKNASKGIRIWELIYLIWLWAELLLIRRQFLLFGTPRFRHVTGRSKGNPCARLHLRKLVAVWAGNERKARCYQKKASFTNTSLIAMENWRRVRHPPGLNIFNISQTTRTATKTNLETSA